MFKFLAVVSSLVIFIEAKVTWHTSQISLRKLYDLQNDHFDAFNKYLELETKRLEELKNHVTAVCEWHNNKITSKDYLHNHLDAINAVRQLQQQLIKVEDLKANKLSIKDLIEIDEQNYLSDDDIVRAYKAMKRLQKFYAISASDLSAGRMNDKIIGDQMDACECFVMAKYCFKENDMYGTIDWAVEAYGKWEKDSQPECVDPVILYNFIVSSSIFTGFNFVNLIKQNVSNYHENSEKIARYYYLMRNELFELEKQSALDINDEYYLFYGQVGNEFRHMCKDGHVSRTLTKYSKCRYQTKNSFYRILMPFKEEDINIDPLVKIYHDVLYDNEILKIIAHAMENMEDAKLDVEDKNFEIEEETRSGQVCKIDGDKDLDSLNSRIESFTEFSTKTAEKYQIVNYGLAGHYMPHYDSFNKGRETIFGNRIITVLFYLTEVQNDGYTSFPWLNVISPAEKGAALVWHNLNLSNGEKDPWTIHGSCPLLKGNKWIMTKWLYEEGQHLIYDWKNK